MSLRSEADIAGSDARPGVHSGSLSWLVATAAIVRTMDEFADALLEHVRATGNARMAAIMFGDGPGSGKLRVAESDPTWNELAAIAARLDTEDEYRDDRSIIVPFSLRRMSGAILVDGIEPGLVDSARCAVHDALPLVELWGSLASARQDASHDALTGLPNRRMLSDALGGAIEEGKRYGTTFALVMLDLDSFKWFNDTYGHLEGDAFLRALADVLQSRVRRSDLAARYGGDEFVLVLRHTQVDEAHRMLERVSAELGRLLSRYDTAAMRLGFSYGVSHFPVDGRDADTLLRRADELLYAAKQDAGVAGD